MINPQRSRSLSLDFAATRQSLVGLVMMLTVASASLVALYPASAQQTYSVGTASHYAHLPDGGEDLRSLGIFVGAFSGNVSNPCSQDAGEPFLEAMIIRAYNSSGIDGGQFSFDASPDGGVGAALAFVGDGGYLAIPQLATSGTLSLQPVVGGYLAGSYTATLISGGIPTADAGTATGSFNVQVCP